MRRALVVLAALALAAPAEVGSAEQVSGPRAKRFVHRLAAMGPRVAGSATERRAGRLVAAELRALGYRIRIQRFRLPEGGVSQNIVGLSRGPVRAIVVAHLDGVAAGPAANDNGSGVAAMLEVARALRGRPGVLVAALGAEERPETGSHLHLGSARLMRGISSAGRRRVRVALSLDMVGVGWSFEVRGLEAAPNRSAGRALAAGRSLGYRVVYHQDTGQSDHAEMTRGGLPAAWIEWRWDTCWHRACDTADRVSAAKMAAAANVSVAAVRAELAA
jgi:Iap family predicted aminopeptidase